MYTICQRLGINEPNTNEKQPPTSMVKLEITKVILTRSEEWALVSYRTQHASGTCGGKFGCHVSLIVAVFPGHLSVQSATSGTGTHLSFRA